MRKKLLLIGILCWWIGLPLLGLISIEWQRAQLRKEIAGQIAAGPSELPGLLLIKVAQGQRDLLRWEHSREFELAGKMYDVARDSAGADTAYYWCLRDEAEERLNREAEATIASGLRRPAASVGDKALESLDWRLGLPPARFSFCLPAPAEQAGQEQALSYAAQSLPPPVPPPEKEAFFSC